MARVEIVHPVVGRAFVHPMSVTTFLKVGWSRAMDQAPAEADPITESPQAAMDALQVAAPEPTISDVRHDEEI